MKTRIIIAAISASLISACVPTPRTPVVVPESAQAKRITRSGGSLTLPDGTRVTPDAAGGFVLPNGDYVRRDPRGALILPTGARCLPDAAGYSCP